MGTALVPILADIRPGRAGLKGFCKSLLASNDPRGLPGPGLAEATAIGILSPVLLYSFTPDMK